MIKNYFIYLIIFFNLLPVYGDNLWLDWDAPECAERLNMKDAKFLNLLRHYECQCHPNYCGVASAVMALNALSVKTAQCSQLGSYRLFTQKGFVSNCVEQKLSKGIVEKRGLPFNQLDSILKTLPINVKTVRALHKTDVELRDALIRSLKNPGQIILANFNRGALNQRGSGHWSPIAAYDSQSDSFLVLDVARFKYSPYWVDAKVLFQGMRTTNNIGESRGFLIIAN